jgi:hypothetical protein
MLRSKEEQRSISPSEEARSISNSLIAHYGIINALDVARCVQEQVQAAINQQQRLHPDEWRQSTQPLQTEPAEAKKPPKMPKIQA